MIKCESILKKIDKVQFSEKSFISCIEDYNNCHSTGSLYIKEGTKRPVVTFGLLAGLVHSALYVEGNNEESLKDQYEYLGTGTMTGLSYSLGIYSVFYFPRNLGRWAISTDLIYTSFSSERTTSYGEVPNTTSVSNFSLKYIKFSPGIRYSSRRQNLKPYFQAGPAIGFDVGSKVMSHLERQPFPDLTFQENIDLQVGIFVGAGIDSKKLGGEVRYRRTNGFSNNRGLVNNLTEFYILFKYTFGRGVGKN